MFKKINILVLVLQFSGLSVAKESMQEFFNRNREEIYIKMEEEDIDEAEEGAFLLGAFNALQPKLDKFIKKGGDINEFFLHPEDENNHNLTILMYAVQNGHVELVQYLLNKGANPLIRNNQGLSVFYYMAIKLVHASYWACIDIDEVLINSLDIFGILLDQIDIKEHKNIFKNWILCFKNLNNPSLNEFIEFEDVSFEKEWNRTDNNELIIGYGVTALEFLKMIPNSSYLKILKYFTQALDESEKTLLLPIMKEYFQELKNLPNQDL